MHPSDDDLDQYVKLSLPPEQSSVVYHHLFACALCRNKARQFAPPPRDEQVIPERRKEVRTWLSAPIWLRILEASAPVLEGRLVNFSKRGLKFQVPRALERGVTVQVRLGGEIIMAEVRYCLAHGRDFHVGAEIHDVFPIPGGAQTNRASSEFL